MAILVVDYTVFYVCLSSRSLPAPPGIISVTCELACECAQDQLMLQKML